MIVRAFYNGKAFKNVVYVVLHERDVANTETVENVTKLIDKNGDVIGYNIVYDKFETDHDGYQEMTYDLLRKVNQETSRTFKEEMIHDFNKYIVVGYVKECKEHPDSDHLHVCEVDVKNKSLQIVCGAANVKQGEYVVVCLENAVLPNGNLIQSGKLRGVESYGMLASEYELGLIDEAKKGILLLDQSYQDHLGKPFPLIA